METLGLRIFPSAHVRLRVLAIVCGCLLDYGTSSAFAGTFSGTGTLTSDYVWRGSTQSNGDPVAQASGKASADSGWYGSIWGSGVQFQATRDAHSEFDLSAGWAGDLSPNLVLDFNLTHYRYPSTSADLDWFETIATLTWNENQWLMIGYSNDALASGKTGVYSQIGVKIALGDPFRLEAAASYYWLDIPDHDSYAHAQLSGIWGFKAPLELRLSLHATDGNAQRLFPDAAGTRTELALQASF